jgi:hypothetical protein
VIDYTELAELADRVLEMSDDDAAELARSLDTLDEEARDALLSSDFLNAYQVYYYYFREEPASELAEERLILSAASELKSGIVIEEVDEYEIIFGVKDAVPVVLISDGDSVLGRFSGPKAYSQAVRFLEENL